MNVPCARIRIWNLRLYSPEELRETVNILTKTAAVCRAEDCGFVEGQNLDVLILCGGSATDLPKQTPEYAKLFNRSGQL